MDTSTVVVNEFYWITPSGNQRHSIERKAAFWKDAGEGPGMLPFAGDGFGDLVLVKVKGAKPGTIHHWNHEGLEVRKIAASLSSFAAGLQRV